MFLRAPADHLQLLTEDVRIRELAQQLWRPAQESESPPAGDAPRFEIEVRARARSKEEGSAPGELDDQEHWSVSSEAIEIRLADRLQARIESCPARVRGWVAESLLEEDPERARRLLLEAPAAVLLSARHWRALHATAFVGERGAVVVRGANGAGKSTLAAACWQRGIELFGDESILASARDGRQLSVSVRELHLRPDAAELLDLRDSATRVWVGGEWKYRIPLASIAPELRQAPHLATVLLGERNCCDRARLRPLDREEFVTLFRQGAIPQESWHGGIESILRAWAERPKWILEGHADLSGATALFAQWMKESSSP